MYEEQHLMASGVPFSDAVTLARSMRKEQALPESVWKEPPARSTCKCGKTGSCPNCPNRKP